MSKPELYKWRPGDIWRREVGIVLPQAFAHRIGGCEDLIKRLELYAELDGHDGCVNTVHFNPGGTMLVSGSDDRNIVFWDWFAKSVILSFPSGHKNNVFQARIMPLSDDKSIVTCAADGQVRHAQLSESGEARTVKLAKHRGRAHKLAVEPGSPRTFFSCGEDGVVRHFDLRDRTNTELLTCYSLSEKARQTTHLNVIVINPRNPNYFAVGGSDKYARVYDVRRIAASEHVDLFSPRHLIKSTKSVDITCIAYSLQEEILVSYNDELIYMFEKGGGLGVLPPKPGDGDEGKANNNEQEVQVFEGHRNARTVKGVNFFGPNTEYVVSGSDCGHVFIWKKRGGQLVALMKGDNHIVNCLEPHPSCTVLATSGIDKTVKVWMPTAKQIQALLRNAKKIMDMNKKHREERTWFSFSLFD